MKVNHLGIAIVTTMLSLRLAPLAAQQESHQMPGMPPVGATVAVSSCAQNSQAVTRTMDAANVRIEDSRQTNDAAKMRAAVGDLQLALAQMKAQLADCVALSQAGSAMSNMAGMDHSKMNMGSTPGAAAAQGSTKGENQTVTIAFRSTPTPPRTGDNEFEVTLADGSGKPVADAEVSLAFYMPPMPSMKMPEMRSTVKLASAENGVYRGTGSVGMAGEWQVTIT
ncbi:MAG: FixH family protein, partial [Acidobacteria bacterium]|nr:FixH family protein [Acidobacteriota bacterium]